MTRTLAPLRLLLSWAVSCIWNNPVVGLILGLGLSPKAEAVAEVASATSAAVTSVQMEMVGFWVVGLLFTLVMVTPLAVGQLVLGWMVWRLRGARAASQDALHAFEARLVDAVSELKNNMARSQHEVTSKLEFAQAEYRDGLKGLRDELQVNRVTVKENRDGLMDQRMELRRHQETSNELEAGQTRLGRRMDSLENEMATVSKKLGRVELGVADMKTDQSQMRTDVHKILDLLERPA